MSQREQWQVAGSAPEVYERDLVPAVFGPWAPILIDLAHPKPGDRVIDIACGTGVVARLVAARVGESGVVVGVDLNTGMLNVARSLKATDNARPCSGRKLVPIGCRFLTARSMWPIASSASSSSLIGRLLCAKCAEFYQRKGGWQ